MYTTQFTEGMGMYGDFFSIGGHILPYAYYVLYFPVQALCALYAIGTGQPAFSHILLILVYSLLQ